MEEEEEEEEGRGGGDELFDEEEDERLRRWVEEEVQGRREGRPLMTQATLSCSRCLALVCYECQRHEEYHTQWRALSMVGVSTQYAERMVDEQTQDAFYAVRCSSCSHQVAVLDEEEVYHIYSVVASDPYK